MTYLPTYLPAAAVYCIPQRNRLKMLGFEYSSYWQNVLRRILLMYQIILDLEFK